MVFIESSLFTARLRELLSDEAYSALQVHLVASPEAGDLIQGSGGLRKVRWAESGMGKRGGVRVIYYHVTADSQIRMLLIYAKRSQQDLLPEQMSELRKLNERWH
jgi:hypothetical protein